MKKKMKKLKLKKRVLEVLEPEKLEEAPGGHSCTCDEEDTCPQTCADSCGGTCDGYTCPTGNMYPSCETDCPPSDCC